MEWIIAFVILAAFAWAFSYSRIAASTTNRSNTDRRGR
jgi:hypothetical protein